MTVRLVLLLVTLLAAAATWAQPASPGGGLVDTRDECIALEGVWKPSRNNNWQSICEVPWSREDCLRLGAAWSQNLRAPRGGTCVAGASEWAMAQQCLDRRGSWSPPGSQAPQCTFEAASVRPVKAKDAGKLCDSHSDCTYGCVYSGTPVAPGVEVMGRCRASNDGSGCFHMVERGKVVGRVCLK